MQSCRGHAALVDTRTLTKAPAASGARPALCSHAPMRSSRGVPGGSPAESLIRPAQSSPAYRAAARRSCAPVASYRAAACTIVGFAPRLQ